MLGRGLSRLIQGIANGDQIALIVLGVIAVIVVVWLVKTIREAKEK